MPVADPGPSRQEEVMAGLLRVRERATAFGYAVLRNFHAAEDAYQEAALVVVRRMDEYTGSGFEVWFWTILRHVLGGRIRAGRRAPVLADTALLERIAGFAGEPAPPGVEEGVDRLAACLEKVGGTMRLVLHWRFLEEAGCEEIAKRLGRSVQGAYGLIKRARQAIRECVQAQAQT
jgi:RNA polymerase sigma-70 factor, ECF subfamily